MRATVLGGNGCRYTFDVLSDVLDPSVADRVRLTISCADTENIPKVAHAGEVTTHRGRRVQIMHNGLYVDEGCYFGPWMTEIIRALRGHHEPQEEAVFHAIVQRLQRDDPPRPLMIEFGSFWAYYSLWFLHAMPAGRALALEPDPGNLAVGRSNAELNDLTDRLAFVHAAVGPSPGSTLQFDAESDGRSYEVVQHDLASALQLAKASRADVVLADIQGAETALLERAREQLAHGAVRFLVVSTHHHSITGDPLTHQKALGLIEACGGFVIAQHSVAESFSGDGLIAASFDPGDADLEVPISCARAKDSLFGEPQFELAAALQEAASARAERDRAVGELQAIRQTRTWRWAQLPRRVYGAVRRLLSRIHRLKPTAP